MDGKRTYGNDFDKNKALKDAKASNHPEDWARARRLRNHIKHIIKRVRANYTLEIMTVKKGKSK